MDFLFYIILSNYVRSILFYQNKNHNVRQIRFHVYIKMRCSKRCVCKRKTLSGQPNKTKDNCLLQSVLDRIPFYNELIGSKSGKVSFLSKNKLIAGRTRRQDTYDRRDLDLSAARFYV